MIHRNNRALLIVIALTAVFVAANGASSPSPSGAHTGGPGTACFAHANAPFYDNGTIKAKGYIDCSREFVQGPWEARGTLLRDGTKVDIDGCHAVGPSTCNVTPAAPNRSGDQKWCLEVGGGANAPVYEKVCETQGF